ncbi:HupE/UreJ family protein [Neptuniibacter sp. QD29_5]|uniref:HupE/UreJ family protein n=1 Tax=Neptuniibacter sp. QD29_5 TaxID=3398207 RepID=UPI0039F5F4B6
MSLRLNQLVLIALSLVVFIMSPMVFAHGMSEAEKQAIIEGGNLSYLWLGATHMLSGYDHLAFVFGIVFLLRSFTDIAKYITAFTVGHSVTLIFATYQAIQINYYLIDAIIALSVCYIAFANLDGFQRLLGVHAPNMLLMVTVLGLIHGFGLSSRLQELPLQADSLLLNIVTFNIGIELGQLIALGVMLVLLNLVRHRAPFQAFAKLTNAGLVVFGGLLCLMQLHSYSHAEEQKQEVTVTEISAVVSQTASAWQDSLVIIIPAQGYKEYKLLQGKDKPLEYEWVSDGPLYFDFHGEPAGDTTGFFQSYEIGTDNKASGAVRTPFAGTHGWYWKNTGENPVTITLNFRGEYLLMQ